MAPIGLATKHYVPNYWLPKISKHAISEWNEGEKVFFFYISYESISYEMGDEIES